MQKNLKSQKGFTLIEMLLVLFIVSTLLFIASVGLKKTYDDIVISTFLNTFENDIYTAQALAISSNSKVKIKFYDGYYEIVHTDGYKRYYNSNIIIDENNIEELYFNKNGNISQGGTMYIYYEEYEYKFIFNLGMGRFYYERM